MKTRVGEKHITKEGYEVVVVEYNSYSDVVVEFCDEYKTKVHTGYGICKKGEIKNVYHKSICGVACIGVMSDGSKPKIKENGKHTREYMVWHSMIKRCYSERLQEKYPTYKDCYVCDRWLCFANFLEDLPLIEGYELWRDNPNQRISLDKDLKQQGIKNKVYSLETCCFIPQSENCKEMAIRTSKSRVGKVGIKPVKVIGVNIKTGEKTKVFESIHDASREIGVDSSHICKCLKGKYKTTGGYQWFKVE